MDDEAASIIAAEANEDATGSFLRALFNNIDDNVTAKEAKAAKAAVMAESDKWRGSYDWGSVASALLIAAFNAIADCRKADIGKPRFNV